MRKILSVVAIVFLFLSCNNNKQSNDNKNIDTIIKTSVTVNPTTRISVKPHRKMPAGFKLDSIKKTDTLLDHQMTYFFPVSLTDKLWNKKLRSFIDKQERDYYPKKSGEEYQSSVFDMWLVAIKETGKETEFKFMMQSYYSGAAHYNQDSACFSYPVKGK